MFCASNLTNFTPAVELVNHAPVAQWRPFISTSFRSG